MVSSARGKPPDFDVGRAEWVVSVEDSAQLGQRQDVFANLSADRALKDAPYNWPGQLGGNCWPGPVLPGAKWRLPSQARVEAK